MKKNIKVLVNGKPFEVEIDNLDGGPAMSVTVNGQAYEVSVEGETASAAPVVKAPAAVAAPAQPARAAAAKPAPVAAASGDAMTAPMPGVILDIAVKPGDKVKYGQQLCALEAMKMKNAIRAPRETVIASVEVHEPQRVNYGEVLFKFSA
ncbi:MAG: acetyl-CoA carboxylase biotin carboxyl carrier protein subunit [Anaerolineae bacterium]|nr:acetyl-CoA carboxylase biotin carboxyl carrier protein subunit [Anaerolineae bacterium]